MRRDVTPNDSSTCSCHVHVPAHDQSPEIRVLADVALPSWNLLSAWTERNGFMPRKRKDRSRR
ncbi:MAG TPA: hypothetical protein VGG74_14570 [Kofleriaceae bacterium]